MKTLQNNFTIPEQSKRLLELGVPADSADCFYLKVPPVEDYVYVLTDNRTYTEQVAVSEFRHSDFLPCWSVGRLIEILSICCSYRHYLPVDYCTVEYIVAIIDNEIKLNRINFSKLEE